MVFSLLRTVRLTMQILMVYRNGQSFRFYAWISRSNQSTRHHSRHRFPLPPPSRHPHRTILPPLGVLGATHAYIPPDIGSGTLHGSFCDRIQRRGHQTQSHQPTSWHRCCHLHFDSHPGPRRSLDTPQREEEDAIQIANQACASPMAWKDDRIVGFCASTAGFDLIWEPEVDIHYICSMDVLLARTILCSVL